MGIEQIIDAWAVVRTGGAPLSSFLKDFADLSLELEDLGGEAAALSLEIRLVLAEVGRGDLSGDEAVHEIDMLIPATASRPLHRDVASVEALHRDVTSTASKTDWAELIPAGS